MCNLKSRYVLVFVINLPGHGNPNKLNQTHCLECLVLLNELSKLVKNIFKIFFKYISLWSKITLKTQHFDSECISVWIKIPPLIYSYKEFFLKIALFF